MRHIIPLSLTSVNLFPVPPTLTVATAGGHTAAGGTAVKKANGAGFSRRSTVKRMGTATPGHLVPVLVAGARKGQISKLETLAFW